MSETTKTCPECGGAVSWTDGGDGVREGSCYGACGGYLRAAPSEQVECFPMPYYRKPSEESL